MSRKVIHSVLGLAACAVAGVSAYASNVDFNKQGYPVFIAKGLVQNTLGWNNNQFQTCVNSTNNTGTPGTGCLEFRVVMESGFSWRCIRFGNNQTVVQERKSVFTAGFVGPVVMRSQNQVTGFGLTSLEVDTTLPVGPPNFSCPSGNGWQVVGNGDEGTGTYGPPGGDGCAQIDAQGNFSSQPIAGCAYDNGRAYWTTGGGSMSLSLKNTNESLPNYNVVYNVPLD
jgi:hypothetical protein